MNYERVSIDVQKRIRMMHEETGELIAVYIANKRVCTKPVAEYENLVANAEDEKADMLRRHLVGFYKAPVKSAMIADDIEAVVDSVCGGDASKTTSEAVVMRYMLKLDKRFCVADLYNATGCGRHLAAKVISKAKDLGRIVVIGRGYYAVAGTEASKHCILLSPGRLIKCIENEAPITVVEIAERLNLNRTTVQESAARLHRSGRIRREKKPGSRAYVYTGVAA